MFHVKHVNRGVISIQGEDRFTFLQGLVTNDVYQLEKQGMIYAAMLTPQGKFLYDFFITRENECLLIECLADIKDQLLKKLTLYKLRARVIIHDVTDMYSIYSVHDIKMETNVSLDPRCAQLGYRMMIKKGDEDMLLKDIPVVKNHEYYEHLRLSLGIPETLTDMIPEKSIPLECGLDQLNAISWSKGCYVGQELTARTHYRGVVRKRLLPVKISGKPSQDINPSIYLDEQEVGKLYSHNQELGIARLRIDDIQPSLTGEKPLTCGESHLVPYVPDWMTLSD